MLFAAVGANCSCSLSVGVDVLSPAAKKIVDFFLGQSRLSNIVGVECPDCLCDKVDHDFYFLEYCIADSMNIFALFFALRKCRCP